MANLNLLRTVFIIQKILLAISYTICRAVYRGKSFGKIVGVEEIANLNAMLSVALPDTKSFVFQSHRFYEDGYAYNLSRGNFLKFLKHILSPIMLGYFLVRYKTFIYISGNGFLFRHLDGRDFEFKQIKKAGGRIVCLFTGSDIRSFALMDEISHRLNMDVITTYQDIENRGVRTERNENIRRMLGQAAERYADLIFNAPSDQAAYINREVQNFLYFYPKENLFDSCEKFFESKRIVLHAPSNPLIKGTPIVRAAVKKLKTEGYDFEYIELSGVENSILMEKLRKAHIVLNQFYSFVPGVFGVEAMASNCVLLTSANEGLEPTLPLGSDEAWIPTPYWNVYDNLKRCLECDGAELAAQAAKGQDWVRTHCSAEANGMRINDLIKSIDACQSASVRGL